MPAGRSSVRRLIFTPPEDDLERMLSTAPAPRTPLSKIPPYRAAQVQLHATRLYAGTRSAAPITDPQGLHARLLDAFPDIDIPHDLVRAYCDLLRPRTPEEELAYANNGLREEKGPPVERRCSTQTVLRREVGWDTCVRIPDEHLRYLHGLAGDQFYRLTKGLPDTERASARAYWQGVFNGTMRITLLALHNLYAALGVTAEDGKVPKQWEWVLRGPQAP